LVTRCQVLLPSNSKLATSVPVSASPTGDTKQLETRQKNLQQLVSPNHKKEKETSFRLITFSSDNGWQFLKVLISAVDYESHFDNKFSVDNLSAFANERFETSSEFDKYFSGDSKSRLKINCILHLITASKTDTFFDKDYNKLIRF